MAKKFKLKQKCDECGKEAFLEVEIGGKVLKLCGECAEELEGVIKNALDSD